MVKRLGDILVELGYINSEELNIALSSSKGIPIGQYLLNNNIITDNQLADALALQTNCNRADLNSIYIDDSLVLITEYKLLNSLSCIPFNKSSKDNALDVIVSDPLNYSNLRPLQKIYNVSKFNMSIETDANIQRYLNKLYNQTSLPDIDEEEDIDKIDKDNFFLERTDMSETIRKLVEYAIEMRASDIHIEPYYTGGGRVRLRIDGDLQLYVNWPSNKLFKTTRVLRLLASIDIATKEASDGQIDFKTNNYEATLRLNSLPLVGTDNWKIVMRILSSHATFREINNIDLSEDNLLIIKRLIRSSNGLYLTTGPTGSGKSATNNAMLHALCVPTKNVVTIENPVETIIKGINQVSVSVKLFSKTLEACLRQDPDVISVGEMRDTETAKTGVNAAITGHIVFSTLHTNNAPETIIRLVEMGIPDYLIASALKMIISQRLLKRICPDCKVVDEDANEFIVQESIPYLDPKATYYKGQGCPKCRNKGSLGRIGVHELLEVNNDLKRFIRKKDIEAIIEANESTDRSWYYCDIKQDCAEKVSAGLISIQEYFEKLLL